VNKANISNAVFFTVVGPLVSPLCTMPEINRARKKAIVLSPGKWRRHTKGSSSSRSFWFWRRAVVILLKKRAAMPSSKAKLLLPWGVLERRGYEIMPQLERDMVCGSKDRVALRITGGGKNGSRSSFAPIRSISAPLPLPSGSSGAVSRTARNRSRLALSRHNRGSER